MVATILFLAAVSGQGNDCLSLDMQGASLLAHEMLVGDAEPVAQSGPEDTAEFTIKASNGAELTIHRRRWQQPASKEVIRRSRVFFLGAPEREGAVPVLIEWPEPPAFQCAPESLQSLRAVATETAASLIGSHPPCPEVSRKAVENLVAGRLDAGLATLYRQAPLSPELTHCLALETISNKPVLAASFTPPWPSWEGIYHHSNQTIGDFMLTVLPSLTGEVVGNPGAAAPEEERVRYRDAVILRAAARACAADGSANPFC